MTQSKVAAAAFVITLITASTSASCASSTSNSGSSAEAVSCRNPALTTCPARTRMPRRSSPPLSSGSMRVTATSGCRTAARRWARLLLAQRAVRADLLVRAAAAARRARAAARPRATTVLGHAPFRRPPTTAAMALCASDPARPATTRVLSAARPTRTARVLHGRKLPDATALCQRHSGPVVPVLQVT